MLSVKNVSIEFDGLVAVNDVNIEVEKNKVTALIGPNGAGKTTLFNIIAGAKKPNTGKVIFDEKDITSLKPYDICELGITRTYQVIKLFEKMTVLDNVLVGMHTKTKIGFFQDVFHSKKMRIQEKEAKEKAHQLLQRFNLDNQSDNLASNLSYGQQRTLEIVRAIASNPKLILLDEPAAGMNTVEKSELSNRIKEIIKMGITVLIVEHDMGLVMGIADKIYVLNSGKNLACGTPNEIANNSAVIEAYLGKGNN